MKTIKENLMNFSFFSGKKLSLVLHIIAWTIFIILPLYFLFFDSQRDPSFLFRVVAQTSIYVFIFYINYLWLVPKYFLKGRKAHYFLSAAILIFCFYVIIELSNTYLFPRNHHEQQMDKLAKEMHAPRPPRQWQIYNYLFSSFLITGFSLGLRLTNKYIENEKHRKELEKERLNSELAFLKNQISPHFFFNTLNNIYSLIQIDTDDAQKSILKLSKLMRYLLYETEHGNVLLSREIEFMNNYVDLMKLRLTDKVHLQVSFPSQYQDVTIPPLLFIPFIENSFKHGVSYREPSFIHIHMQTSNHELLFTCMNSLRQKPGEHADKTPGIGLENIRKRLALLFPEKHELVLAQTEVSFEVKLKIEIPTHTI